MAAKTAGREGDASLKIQRETITELLANIYECVSPKSEMFVILNSLGINIENGDQTHGKQKFIRHLLQALDEHELLEFAKKSLSRFEGGSKFHPYLQDLASIINPIKEESLKYYFSGLGKPDIIVKDVTRGLIEVRDLKGCIEATAMSTETLTWRMLGEQQKSRFKSFPDMIAYMGSSIPKNSPQAKLMFDAYVYKTVSLGSYDAPALMPELHLHYDPMAKKFRGGFKALNSQRVDFFMKLSNGEIIIEVDGIQHYALPNGMADRKGYGEQCAWDREKMLAGYQIFRFGTVEFDSVDINDTIETFFDKIVLNKV